MDYVKLFDSIVNGSSENRYLIFSIGKRSFAVPSDRVIQIIEPGTVSPVPETPDYITGITSFRGEIVPVVELGKIFGLEGAAGTRRVSIVMEFRGKKCAFTVDSVDSLENVESKTTAGIEALKGLPEREFILSILKVEDRLVLALRLDMLLDFDELSKVMEVVKNTDRNQ